MDEDAVFNLKNHKYAGNDFGITWVYFYNPVAKWLVQFIPDWIAPNLITFVGFLHSIAAWALVYAFFGTDCDSYVANWFCIFCFFAYFAYRMLDEMDGKHARKTGNGSPLGLLFDHGCDAFALGIWAIINCKLSVTGENITQVFTMVTVYFAFHFATL